MNKMLFWVLIIVLAVASLCFCNGESKFVGKTLEVWYLPFTIDTRIPINEQSIKKNSYTRYTKILNQQKINEVETFVGKLQEVSDSNTVSKNIRVLVKLNDGNDTSTQFAINFNKKILFSHGKIFYCNCQRALKMYHLKGTF